MQLFLAKGDLKKAAEIFQRIEENYVEVEKEVGGKDGSSTKKALEYMEKHMSEPIKFRVADSHRSKMDLHHRDMLSVPKKGEQ